jgi:hypothetical protein
MASSQSSSTPPPKGGGGGGGVTASPTVATKMKSVEDLTQHLLFRKDTGGSSSDADTADSVEMRLRGGHTPRSFSLPISLSRSQLPVSKSSLSGDNEIELDDFQFERLNMLDGNRDLPRPTIVGSPDEEEEEILLGDDTYDEESHYSEDFKHVQSAPSSTTSPIPKFKKQLSPLTTARRKQSAQKRAEEAKQALEALKNTEFHSRASDPIRKDRVVSPPPSKGLPIPGKKSDDNLEEKLVTQSQVITPAKSGILSSSVAFIKKLASPKSTPKNDNSEVKPGSPDESEKNDPSSVRSDESQGDDSQKGHKKKKGSATFSFLDQGLQIPDSESEAPSALNSNGSSGGNPTPQHKTAPNPLSSTNKSRTKKSNSMLAFRNQDRAYKSPYLVRKLAHHVNMEAAISTRALASVRKASASSDHSQERSKRVHYSEPTKVPVMEIQSPKPIPSPAPSAKSSPTNTSSILDSSGKFVIREQSALDERLEEMVWNNKYYRKTNEFVDYFLSEELKDPTNPNSLKAKAVIFGLFIVILFAIYELVFHVQVRESWFGWNSQVLSFVLATMLLCSMRWCDAPQLFYYANYTIGLFIFANASTNYILGGKGRLSMAWLCLAPPLSLLSSGLMPAIIWNLVVIAHCFTLFILWITVPWIFVQDEYANTSSINLILQNPLLCVASTLVAVMFWSSNLSYVVNLERANVALEAVSFIGVLLSD